jgi:hypothetical protein
MYDDGVGQRERQLHFFQPSLHQNKVPKSLYYTSGPCCLDVCVEIFDLKSFPFYSNIHD